MELTKNKVLITGGNKGIGLALAKKFLTLGNQVIITGRNEKDLVNAKRDFPQLFTFKCDLANQEGLDKLSLYIQNIHSDTNILINNAGVQFNYMLMDEPQTLNKIEYEININLIAPLKLTTMLLPILDANKNAAIVNVSSALAMVPKTTAPIYSASKSGIQNFSIGLRQQLDKIKVFEIIPALVDTEMTKGRGKGKMAPETLANEFIKAFERNKYEVSIGKVKLLRLVNWISPKLASRIINGK